MSETNYNKIHIMFKVKINNKEELLKLVNHRPKHYEYHTSDNSSSHSFACSLGYYLGLSIISNGNRYEILEEV